MWNNIFCSKNYTGVVLTVTLHLQTVNDASWLSCLSESKKLSHTHIWRLLKVKGEWCHASLEKAHLPVSVIELIQCDAWPVQCQTYDYFPISRTLPPLGCNQINILFGDKRHMDVNNCYLITRNGDLAWVLGELQWGKMDIICSVKLVLGPLCCSTKNIMMQTLWNTTHSPTFNTAINGLSGLVCFSLRAKAKKIIIVIALREL